MKKRLSLILLCGIVLLGVCGCGNTSKIEEIPFNMACADNTKLNDAIIIERYTNALIIPKDTIFFKDDTLFKDGYYCYDTDTKESIPSENISIDTSEINVNAVGNYKLKVNAKYDNKVGNTEVEVKVVESCSGNCTIQTTNWKFEIFDNTQYTDEKNSYYTLKQQVKLYPTENANFSSALKNTAKYSNIIDGDITLRYLNNKGSFYSKAIASDNDYDVLDDALSLHYRLNENKVKQQTFLKYYVVPKIEAEAFIDFYDKVKDEHHFYYIHK